VSVHLSITAIIDLSLPPLPLTMARVPKAHTKHPAVYRRRYQISTIPVSQHPRHKPPSRQNSRSNSSEEGDSESNFEDDADIEFDLTDIDIESDFENIDPISDLEDNDLESELDIITLDLESNIDSGYSSDQELAVYHEKLNPGHVSTQEQAEYLHQRRCHYAQQGPSMANHGDRTRAIIKTTRVYFLEYVFSYSAPHLYDTFCSLYSIGSASSQAMTLKRH